MSDVYFEGDPETDSARRRLERLLKQPEPPPSRWPWIVAALGSGGLWMMFKWGRAAAGTKRTAERQDEPKPRSRAT